MGLRNFRASDFARTGEGDEPKLGDDPLPLSRVPKAGKPEPKAEESHGDPGDLILP